MKNKIESSMSIASGIVDRLGGVYNPKTTKSSSFNNVEVPTASCLGQEYLSEDYQMGHEPSERVVSYTVIADDGGKDKIFYDEVDKAYTYQKDYRSLLKPGTKVVYYRTQSTKEPLAGMSLLWIYGRSHR